MWDLLRSRRALASVVAVVVAAISIVLAISPRWRSAIGGPFLTASSGSDSASGQAPASAQTAADPAGSTAAESTGKVASTASGSTNGQARDATPASTDPASPAPTFDIVRVSPNGDSVIAARATPNTELALMDGDTVIARAKTDANGQVAFLPLPLKSGEHSLVLSTVGAGQGGPVSSQSVAVSVPEQAQTAPMVAVLQPGEAAKVLSGPVAGSLDPAHPESSMRPQAGAPAPSVAIQSVEAEDQGSFFATGKAVPGSQCHVYLNGSFVAAVTADGKGLWSLQINRGMKPGHYAVRVDQIEAKTGKVIARAEVPFDYPVGPMTAAAPAEMSRKASSSGPSGVSATAIPAQTTRLPGAPAQPGKVALARLGVQGGTERPRTDASAPFVGIGKTADASGTNGTSLADAQAAAMPTVINELLTAKVIRGDTLWRISRKMLGHGMRYTQIYAANTQQIRNPRLIFPGQVFVMPHIETR